LPIIGSYQSPCRYRSASQLPDWRILIDPW
jgi:hypothetical protein